jgi:hypothetical protein
MFASLTTLFQTLGAVLEAIGDWMARDIIDVGQNYLGAPAAGPDGMSDFLDGFIVMLGQTGAGLGELITALGVFLASL